MAAPDRPAVKRRQVITVTVTTPVDRDPVSVVLDALRRSTDLTDFVYTNSEPMQKLPGINRERLIELAQWVAGEDAKRRLRLPSEWDQSDWLSRNDNAGNTCGTACCIAGKVALDDGGRPVMSRWDDDADDYVEADWVTVPGDEGWTTGFVRFPGEDAKVNVREYAKDTLGLDARQAARLFSGGNDLDDVINVIRDLLAEADKEQAAVVPPSPPVTRRVRRRGVTNPCRRGEDCNFCYRDVPVQDDVPF